MTTEGTIAIICSLVGAVTSVLMVIFMNRKQRNEVSYAFVPAAKQDFDKHLERNKIEHDLLAEKIIAARREIDIHISSRAKTIFDKMDQATGSLRAEMERQTDRRDASIAELRENIDTKLDSLRKELTDRTDDIPAQTITLLKNTGAI